MLMIKQSNLTIWHTFDIRPLGEQQEGGADDDDEEDDEEDDSRGDLIEFIIWPPDWHQ